MIGIFIFGVEDIFVAVFLALTTIEFLDTVHIFRA